MSNDQKEFCFACTTPYQILGAIGIVQTLEGVSDLVIYGMFPNYETVGKRIQERGPFRKVYLADGNQFGAPGHLGGFFQMVFSKHTVARYMPDKSVYDTLYISSNALPKVILQHVLQTRNPHMKTVFFEDGMGTYSPNSHPLNPTQLAEVTAKLLGWQRNTPENSALMAFLPDLVEPPAHLRGIRVDQMPRLPVNAGHIKELQYIFSVDSSTDIMSKVIIFDTLRDGSGIFTPDEIALLDRCYCISAEKTEKKDILIKPHPRSTIKSDLGIALYPYQGIPMELLFYAMSDLDNQVLISLNSTAMFTPKILFDQEPEVISLHRLFKDAAWYKVFDEIFVKFQKIYSDQTRIHAPESLDELSGISLSRADRLDECGV